MKKSTTIMWFVASLLMIVAGIVCFVLPVGTSIRVFSYIVGALVLCMGIVELVMFFTSVGIVGGGMFLADGIITTLLGIFFLANVNVVEAILPIVFAMWFIYEGISELVLAIQAGKFKVSNWWVLLIIAIAEIIFGFVALFDPVSSSITITVLAGIFLFVRGLSMLGDWIIALRVKNFAKNWLGKAANVFGGNNLDDQRVDEDIDRQ